MSPVRKTHTAKRRGQPQKYAIVASVLLIVAVLTAAYVLYPRGSANNSLNNQVTPSVPIASVSPAFSAFTDHYLGVMQSLNQSQTRLKMAQLLSLSYNQTDLFSWEKTKLTFAQDPAGLLEDPLQILSSGKGICVQWSIVYVSACLALGYQSRLVVSVDTSSWSFIHMWAEDYYNGAWVNVDPSDAVWNSPSRYQSWDWGKLLGSGVAVYAFEDGSFYDVTSIYSAH